MTFGFVQSDLFARIAAFVTLGLMLSLAVASIGRPKRFNGFIEAIGERGLIAILLGMSVAGLVAVVAGAMFGPHPA